VTIAPSPAAVPASPRSSGARSVATPPAGGTASDRIGAVVSIVNVLDELRPVFPAVSPCSARAVYAPSASGAARTDHAPPTSGAESVCTGGPEAAPPA